LRPLTELRPKALCPVGNEPLVDRSLRQLQPLTHHLAVNAHAQLGQMQTHLRACWPGVHLSAERVEALGTAGAIGLLREWIAGRSVVVHNVDAWHRADLASLLADGWDGERMRLLVVDRPERGDFGPWMYAGACLLPWSVVEKLQPVPSGLYEVAMHEAERNGELDLVPYDGPWFDCGTPATYLGANLEASGGETVIGDGARVEGEAIRSVIWPGAAVARGERLIECIRTETGLTVQVERRAA
jgi:NDP-sugar pyrophosphorylase family protein